MIRKPHFNIRDSHRAEEIRRMRKAMQYRHEDYVKDWELAVAIAQIMAVEGETEHMRRLLENTFNRIYAYQPLSLQNPF